MVFTTNQHLEGNPKIFGIPTKELSYIMIALGVAVFVTVTIFVIGFFWLAVYFFVAMLAVVAGTVFVLIYASSQSHPRLISSFIAFYFMRKKIYPVLQPEIYISPRYELEDEEWDEEEE